MFYEGRKQPAVNLEGIKPPLTGATASSSAEETLYKRKKQPAVDLVDVQLPSGGAVAWAPRLHLSKSISWIVLHWRVGTPHLHIASHVIGQGDLAESVVHNTQQMGAVYLCLLVCTCTTPPWYSNTSVPSLADTCSVPAHCITSTYPNYLSCLLAQTMLSVRQTHLALQECEKL